MLAAKGMRFPIDVILVCIRWYAAYPLSYRHLEEMMHMIRKVQLLLQSCTEPSFDDHFYTLAGQVRPV